MSDSENKGGLTVELDADDIMHLTVRGTSTVTKEIGPIDVKVRCKNRVYPKFVMETAAGETVETEVFDNEQ